MNSLDKFKLYYEELPEVRTRIAKPKKHLEIKSALLEKYDHIKDVVNKTVHRSKKAKKLTKSQRLEQINERNRAIMGIGSLFVVVSITYSTTLTLMGVNSWQSKFALLPQVIFALITLLKAFSKLYK